MLSIIALLSFSRKNLTNKPLLNIISYVFMTSPIVIDIVMLFFNNLNKKCAPNAEHSCIMFIL